jgi:hypothetical protein
MVDATDDQDNEGLTVKGDTKSSARALAMYKRDERAFNNWQAVCDHIDEVYSMQDGLGADAGYVASDHWGDQEYDLFWASTEILKPAIYARPPEPVVSPQFKDKRKLQSTTAEMLERTAKSSFQRGDLDEAMCLVRDDLIFYNRGVLWLTYETDKKGGGQRVCYEQIDRKDFLHSPARKWSEVPRVYRRAWMWPKEMRERFSKHSGDAWKDVKLCGGEGEEKQENRGKGGVVECWDREAGKVYWFAEGASVLLDHGEPHLKLRSFFPCPRPAYGTLRRRSLVPSPDYLRYAKHFAKINSLTRRIYDLLDMVRMKGLIPAGGEIGDAVEQALKDDANSALLIPVPSAALIQGSSNFVQWMPLTDIATAITGLIEARRELFSDYDRLSGISDIMRGETEAEETLGAQQLKSQYGSVRVREKIDELQRIAKDATEIAAEIMAENFSKETFLEMSQMEIPTAADIEKRSKAIEKAAKEELGNLTKQAEQMAAKAKASGEQIDLQQAQAQFDQARQAIVTKYATQLQAESDQVPIEDVMKLLRDQKARGFAFEIATDSTILTDELQEKQSRNEFLTVFSGATQGMIALAGLGEPAAKLAGGVLKFVLAPYRVGRELDALIDDFIDAAPQMAAQAAGDGGGEDAKALAEAQNKLAEAEMTKAQAQTLKVQSDAARDQAEAQRKMQEMQGKLETEAEKLRQQSEANSIKFEEMLAKVDNIRADTMKKIAEAGVAVDNQALNEFTSLKDIELRERDQAIGAAGMVADQGAQAREAQRADREQAIGAEQSAREGERADRQQDFAERSGERQQALAERAQSASERQAMQERPNA